MVVLLNAGKSVRLPVLWRLVPQQQQQCYPAPPQAHTSQHEAAQPTCRCPFVLALRRSARRTRLHTWGRAQHTGTCRQQSSLPLGHGLEAAAKKPATCALAPAYRPGHTLRLGGHAGTDKRQPLGFSVLPVNRYHTRAPRPAPPPAAAPQRAPTLRPCCQSARWCAGTARD